MSGPTASLPCLNARHTQCAQIECPCSCHTPLELSPALRAMGVR